MNRILYPARMFCAYLTLILSAVLLITACSGSGRPTETSTALDSIPIPAISEDTAPIHDPVFPAYPFSFFTEDGEEITVELPCDPEQYAELHACTLDDAGALYHAILYSVEPEVGVLPEEVRVFSFEDGREYPVVPVGEILSRYVTVTSEEGLWRMNVGGAAYEVPKSQFSGESQSALSEMPDMTRSHDFYIENGHLFCRVSLLCGADDLYAAEGLRIRFTIDGEGVTADEITFERQETETVEAEDPDLPA